MTLGQKIWKARVNAGFDGRNGRSEFAKAIKADTKTVWRWENDRNVPSNTSLIAIASLLGVEEDYFKNSKGEIK